MATFNSNSGGAISTCKPQQNLVLSLSSKNFKSSGDLSDDTIICLESLCKLLNVWKNSCCDAVAPPRNWISSILTHQYHDIYF